MPQIVSWEDAAAENTPELVPWDEVSPEPVADRPGGMDDDEFRRTLAAARFVAPAEPPFRPSEAARTPAPRPGHPVPVMSDYTGFAGTRPHYQRQPAPDEIQARKKMQALARLEPAILQRLADAERRPSGIVQPIEETGLARWWSPQAAYGFRRFTTKALDAFALPAAVFSAILRGAGIDEHEYPTLAGGSFGEISEAVEAADPRHDPGMRIARVVGDIAAIPVQFYAMGGAGGAATPLGTAFRAGARIGGGGVTGLMAGVATAEAAMRLPGVLAGESDPASEALAAATAGPQMFIDATAALSDVGSGVRAAVKHGGMDWEDVAELMEQGEPALALATLYAFGKIAESMKRPSNAELAEARERANGFREALVRSMIPNRVDPETGAATPVARQPAVQRQFRRDELMSPDGPRAFLDAYPGTAEWLARSEVPPSRRVMQRFLARGEKMASADRAWLHERLRAIQAEQGFRDATTEEVTKTSAVPAEQPVTAERQAKEQTEIGAAPRVRGGREEAQEAEALTQRSAMRELADRWEAEAVQSIQSRAGTVTSGVDPAILADYAKYGAAQILRGVSTVQEMATALAARFGDAARVHAEEVFDRARALTMGLPAGIQNRLVDDFRERRGLPPIMREVERGWHEVKAEGDRRFDADPNAGRALAEDIIAGQRRAQGDIEQYMLAREYVRASVGMQRAIEKLEDARARGDLAAIAEAEAAERLAAGVVERTEEAARTAGVDWGRAGRARQILIGEDYSLQRVLARAVSAKGGAPISPEEYGRMLRETARVRELEAKLAEHEALEKEAVREKQAGSVFAELDAEAAAGKGRARPARDRPIAEMLRDAVESGASPGAITGLARELAIEKIESGIHGREPVTEAVHADLAKMLPDWTIEQTRLAISGYGEFTRLTKDPAVNEYRQIRGELQQLEKLRDMAAGRAPRKTGQERPEMGDEWRRLVKLVNEAKRRGGFEVQDPARQLRTELESKKTRLRHAIADAEWEIAHRQRIVARKASGATDPEIESMKARLAELRAQQEEIFGKPELTDAQRLAIAIASAERGIALYEERVRNKDIGPLRGPSKTPKSEALDALKQRRDALKAELQALRELASPRRTPEEIADARYESYLRNRIADARERIMRGDFAPGPPKPPRKLTKEGERLRHELEDLKSEIRGHEEAWRRARRTLPAKVTEGVGEVFNLLRTWQLGLDLGVLRRQAGPIARGRPIMAAKAMDALARGFSRRGYHAVMNEIHGRENFKNGIYKRAGLELQEFGARRLSHQEEMMMSRLADRVPVLAHSNRAQAAFLNRLRADLFDHLTGKLASRAGEVTDAGAKIVANYVNVVTGRGNLGRFRGGASTLATLMLAPRWVLSRFQLALGQPLWTRAGARELQARRIVAEEYARSMAGLAAFYGSVALAASLLGLEDQVSIGTDARKSDFLKITIGDTQIDPASGLSQVLVFMNRLRPWNPETVNPRGEVSRTGSKQIWQFARQRFAPVVAEGLDALLRADVWDIPTDWRESAEDVLTPLVVRDIVDAYTMNGGKAAAAVGLLGAIGYGVNTLRPRVRQRDLVNDENILTQARRLAAWKQMNEPPHRTAARTANRWSALSWLSQRGVTDVMVMDAVRRHNLLVRRTGQGNVIPERNVRRGLAGR